MTLTLDHIQRLNLMMVLETLECRGRREAFQVCKLQDKLDLNEEEKSSIEFKRLLGPNGDYFQWNMQKSIEPREYEFNEEDSGRILRALDNANLVLGRDRWYRGLQKQLPEPAETNGNHRTPL